jgi:hypothetical protein
VLENHAYIADWHEGLQIIDISDPENPQIIGEEDSRGPADGIAVLGGVAYIGDYYGLQVIDVTEPFNPQTLGRAETPDESRAVAVLGDHVYVADGYQGLQILPIQCDPASAVSEGGMSPPKLHLHLSPNPTSGRMAIHTRGYVHGHLRVAIYSPEGRLIRDLSDGILNARNEVLSWDGRDSGGRPVPEGVYLIQANAAQGARTGRLVIVR